MKFNKLDVPHQWKDYFTKYPHGYTIFEALCNWTKQVDNMVDNQNHWNDYLDNFVEHFEFELQEEVKETLTKWQNEGRLDDIINSALNTRLDDFEDETHTKFELINSALNTRLDDFEDETHTKFELINSQLGQSMNGNKGNGSVWTEFEERGVNVKWFGVVGDGINDDTENIQNAINFVSNINGVLFFPRGIYRITDTLIIDDNTITLTGIMESGSNDRSKSSQILYDGPVGKDMILIGGYETKSVNPIIIKYLMFNGGSKARMVIHTNRANVQSKIEHNFFFNCLGFLKLENCYYMSIKDNVFSYSPKDVTTIITDDLWAYISNGLIQMSVANNVEFEKNSIQSIYIKYRDEKPENLIKINRQESLHFNMNTIEACEVNSLLLIGDTSAGNNLQITHTYLEHVHATSFVYIRGYALGDIDIQHTHFFSNDFGYLIGVGSPNYTGTVRMQFAEFRSDNSVGRIVYSYGTGASFEFENCFFGVGRWVFTSGGVIIEPSDGSGGTYDNTLGIKLDGRSRIKTQPITRESYIEGFDNVEFGSDDKGEYLLVPYDGNYGLINGKGIRLSRSTGSGVLKQKFRPNRDGVWYAVITCYYTLNLVHEDNINDYNYLTYSIRLFKFEVLDGHILSDTLDFSVRRPKGLYAGHRNGIIFRNSNPQNEDINWLQGDYAINSVPVENGSSGNKYVIRGWVCVQGGTGSESRWVEDRAYTGN